MHIALELCGKAPQLVESCRLDGLLINSTSEENIRLLPPLIIEDKDIQTGLRILKKNLELLSL